MAIKLSSLGLVFHGDSRILARIYLRLRSRYPASIKKIVSGQADPVRASAAAMIAASSPFVYRGIALFICSIALFFFEKTSFKKMRIGAKVVALGLN